MLKSVDVGHDPVQGEVDKLDDVRLVRADCGRDRCRLHCRPLTVVVKTGGVRSRASVRGGA